MTTAHEALCCWLTAITTSAAEQTAPDDSPDPADEFDHVYPSSMLTLPYCEHDAAVGRHLGRSELDRDGIPQGVQIYDRWELAVARAAPVSPADGARCTAGIYGDCTSTGRATLAGHHYLVDRELERLLSELVDRFCQCMTTNHGAGGGYSASWPAWIESAVPSTEGRFTVTRFVVAAQIR